MISRVTLFSFSGWLFWVACGLRSGVVVFESFVVCCSFWGSVGIGVLNSSRKGVESSCVSEGIGEGLLSKFSHLVSDWRIPFFHPDLEEIF